MLTKPFPTLAGPLCMLLLCGACATTSSRHGAAHEATDPSTRHDSVETPHRGPPPRPSSEVKDFGLRWERSDGAPALAFIDGRVGQSLAWEEVVARAQSAEVVLVGEQHDQRAHHELQARLIGALGENPDKRLAVALEMVPWSMQAPLVRFAAAGIDADGLKAALSWETTWGHDFELYRDVFEVGRSVGATFVGVNAPRALVRSLAKEGLEGLSKQQRQQLPQLDLGDEEHRAAIESVFRQHHPPAAGGVMERFYAAQVLWDESMAEGTSKIADGTTQVVVLAGNGHVAGYRGVPNRLLRRKPHLKILTVVPVTLSPDDDPADVAKQAIAAGEADILVLIAPREVLAI